MFENISDSDLRKELTKLTGKDVGPITSSTRPVLIRKLQKLQEPQKSVAVKSSPEKSKKKLPGRTSTPYSGSLGFSSDEELFAERKNVSKKKEAVSTTKRKSQATTKSTTNVLKKSTSSSFVRKHDGLGMNENSVPTIEQLMEWSSDKLQSKLYTLTGKRYVVNESTKLSLARRLQGLLTDKDSFVSRSSSVSGIEVRNSAPSSEPMETFFSDTDDGDGEMDFDTSPVMSQKTSKSTRAIMVNQSANTSSFLDQTLPDPPEDDPGYSSVPPKPPNTITAAKQASASTASKSKQSPELPLKLPSPNLSSTRRSFVPSSAVNSPAFLKPVPSSPPKSTFARRPLTGNTRFFNLNPDITPKPSSRFSAVNVQPQTTEQRLSRDHLANYNTGAGKVIKSRKLSSKGMDEDEVVPNNETDSTNLLANLCGLALFMALLLYVHSCVTAVPPEGLESVFAPDDEYRPLLNASGICQLAQCFSEDEMRGGKPLAEKLSVYLAEHAGYAECGYTGFAERSVAESVARKDMQDLHGKAVLESWPAMLELIKLNPHWNIRLALKDKEKATSGATKNTIWLESVHSVTPLSCQISSTLIRILLIVFGILIVSGLGYLAFIYGRYRKREQKRQEDIFYDLLENVLDMLEAQCKLSKENPREQPFLAISHIHDTIISPQERQQMQGIWRKVVQFMPKETRVREEVQRVHGEEFTVWRWIQPVELPPAPGKNDGWGDSAIGRYKLNFRPTECLKVRGMFDVYSESGSEWHLRIRDALLEKLGDEHGVVHIAVDQESSENRVYMKFASTKQAGKAFEKLHGFYYEGQCIQCKFLLLKTYHERFPPAEHSLIQLERSNKTTAGHNRLYPTLKHYR
ncbi:uncharacterized protein [Watersipora subatra]|uniref:uncharacterized protein n=1 Tax=Watersipora subatra TaxID=2589382 RepID=UPI00355B7E86